MKHITTEKIVQILTKYERGEGIKRSENIFFHGNVGILNVKYPFLRSKGEMIEWVRCHDDLVYFIEKYCKIHGFHIELRDYQKAWIGEYLKNSFCIFLNTRQVGYSIIKACINIWEVIFHDRSILSILSNNGESNEHMDKMKEVFLGLPYFMKTPVVNWDKNSVRFSGDQSVKCVSGNSVKGVDDFDVIDINSAFHIPSKKQEGILRSLIPILSSKREGRVCIGGLPVGINPFYELTQNPGFSVTRTYWWQVPGRDEEWVRQMKLSCGSEQVFEQEYEMKFRSR